MRTPVVGATGPGPMPGTDTLEAAEIVMGECGRQPFLPELAERGVGADAVGRTAAMLADLAVDTTPRGWRLVNSRSRRSRLAKDYLDRDCDALEEIAAGQPPGDDGRLVQVRAMGPWSLAAALELPAGRLVLTDSGARRDLAASLAEGLAARVTRIADRLDARPLVVLDEPMLWRVTAGAVPTASRFDPAPAVPADRLAMSLCRFADQLRALGIDSVLVRPPAPGELARWDVVTTPPRDETPLDGLVLPTAPLVPAAGSSPDHPAPDHPAPEHPALDHPALDAAGTTLSEGGILQLEGLTPLGGLEDSETAVRGILELLDRLSAPRYHSLDQLVLTPAPDEVRAGVVTALSAARRIADAAPHFAQ